MVEGLPSVSVLMPVHNGMPYLPIAVESILAQTFRDFELIVLDDGSTDESPQYLQSFSDPRVRYVRLERMRLVGALNHGLSLARAPLVARMDADDIADCRRLEVQVAMFNSDEGLVAASVQFDRIDQSGQRIGTNRDCVSDAAIRWYLLFSPAFLHPGMMFRKDEVIAAGGYSKEFDVAEDYDLWTRLSSRGRFANSPEVLMKYRSTATGVSSNNRDRQRQQTSMIAGRYANLMFPEVEPLEWEAVRRAIVGDPIERSQVVRVGKVFQRAAAKYLQSHAGESEVVECVQAWRERLRWRALAAARHALPDVGLAYAWYSSARACGFGVGSLARQVSKRLGFKVGGRRQFLGQTVH